MSKKGDIIIDEKSGLVYTVKDVQDSTVVIERIIPPSHILSELELAQCGDEENTRCVL